MLGILIAGAIVTALLIKCNPARDYRELRLRVRTWWWIVTPLATSLAIHPLLATGLFTLVSALALREYLVLVERARLRTRGYRGLLYLVVPAQYGLAYAVGPLAAAVFMLLAMLMLVPGVALLDSGPQQFLRRIGLWNVGLLLTVFSLSHLAALLGLPDRINPPTGAVGLVVFILIITQVNDVAQYVWGRLLGRTPIAPQLSPAKTAEGLAGGMITTSVLSFLLGPLLTPLAPLACAAGGLAIALVGFAGDLTVSAIKRDCGVKDAGRLLPGHGGILDRADSLIYTAPCFFYGILWLSELS